jgi:threonylcarbamoyladenosine tRNA methylthiotransferase MtaB
MARECGFSKIHAFPFSPRRGTPAAEMPGQVAPQVKHERIERLRQLENELQTEYYRSLIGCRLTVLVEGQLASGRWAGTSCRYAPVELPSGDFQEFALVAATPGALVCGAQNMLTASRHQR